MKYKPQYKCRLCGGIEAFGEIELLDPPAHLAIYQPYSPIWHQCFKPHAHDHILPIGYGICDFAGLVPVKEKEKPDGGE
jgi:hypothetical protein